MTEHSKEPRNSHAITLRNVTKLFVAGNETVKAVEDVTLRVKIGEFVALEGPSGSGKTTLLNLIGLLDLPTSGTVSLLGEDAGALGKAGRVAMLRNEIGFVFQEFFLLPYLSVTENIILPLLLSGSKARCVEARALGLMERFDIAGKRRRKPSELSAGEKQRVALARALVSKPRILLADEPTGNLDESNKRIIVDLLTELNVKESLTVIVASHDPDLAGTAGRRVRLDHGKIV